MLITQQDALIISGSWDSKKVDNNNIINEN